MNHHANTSALTPLEKQTLHALSLGKTHKLIAIDCAIGVDAVKKRLHRIYQKLDVRTAREAISKAYREQLLE